MSWHWDKKEQHMFKTLCDKMISKPILQQPNFEKVFYLQTDTLKYRVGVVLSQEGEANQSMLRRQHLITFYSATFSLTEQNYNAYDLEFLGVLKLIEHWWPYLIWTKEPFIIETNHKNLTY